MTILFNRLTEPDGDAIAAGWVNVQRLGSPLQAAGESEVLGGLGNYRFTDGFWEVTLAPGLYRVVQHLPDGTQSRWTVNVPDSEQPVWLGSCLVEVPGTPSSTPLLGIRSAIVDVDGHLRLTYTDGAIVDAGKVVGPPWTDSQAEFDAAVLNAVEGVGGGESGGTVTSADITDATPVGRNVLTAGDAAEVRAEIGAAATSDLDAKMSSSSVDDVVSLTQAQFDALGTKAARTLYLIVG